MKCLSLVERKAELRNATRDAHDASNLFGRRRLIALNANATLTEYALEFDGVENVKIIASLASLLGCFFIIITYILFPPLRRYHSMMVVWIALMGMLFHGTTIVQTQAYGYCCVSAAVTQVALLSQEFYFFALAFNFYYLTKYPFRSTKVLLPVCHALVWILSGVSAYIAGTRAAGTVNSYGFCWYSSFDSRDEEVLVTTFIIPVAIGYSVSIGLYFLATRRVRLGAERLHATARTNLDTMRNYLLWSAAYWLLVVGPYMIRHLGGVALNSPEEKGLRFFGRIWLALKGLVSAIGWARIMSMRNAYALWKKGNWDDYMKIHEATWVLRRQIVYFATKGIQYSATLTSEDGGDSAHDTPNSVQRGSITSQWSNLNPWSIRLNSSLDGPSVISYELQGATNDQKALFRDFHPTSFAEIRRLSGISDEGYIRSFSGRTKERFSEGKSGSFLYYTGDQLFILKTCTPAEQRYLLHILPQYMAHLRDHPNSYLCRYVGCHELVLEHHSVRFIVLTNILNNTAMNVDEFYDLKGSWVGRFRMLTHNGTQRVCKYCGRDFIVGMSKEICVRNPNYGAGHAELVVGKDLNWGGRHLRLPDEIANQLGTQLYADSEFLRRINSMDYSLIIGMSRYPTFSFTASSDDGASDAMGLKSMQRSTQPQTEDDINDTPFYDTTYAQAASPVVSRSREFFPSDACVVSMGIIDILTPWSLRKSLEHWFRVYIQCRASSGISCVNPTLYAERFRQNVVDVVIFGEGRPRKRRGKARSNRPSKEYIMVDFSNTNTPIL